MKMFNKQGLEALAKTASINAPLHEYQQKLAAAAAQSTSANVSSEVGFEDEGGFETKEKSPSRQASPAPQTVPFATAVDDDFHKKLRIHDESYQKEEELRSREERVKVSERQVQEDRERLKREGERAAQEKHEAEIKRKQQLLKDQLRQKRQERATFMTMAQTFKMGGVLDAKSYDLAIMQFQNALYVDMNDPAELLRFQTGPDLQNSENARIYFEIADCKLLKKDFIGAYNDLIKLRQHQSLFNPMPNVTAKIESCKAEIIGLADDYLIEARKFFSNKKIAEARHLLAKIKPLWAAISYKDYEGAVAKLETEMKWFEIKATVNQLADQQIRIASSIDSFTELQLTVLIRELASCKQSYDTYISGLDASEISRFNLAKEILMDAENRLRLLRLQHSWSAKRDDINQLFAIYQALPEKYENLGYDYHVVMRELLHCRDSYRTHNECLSNEERGFETQLELIINVAQHELNMQMIREKREADRRKNQATETRINNLLLEVQALIVKGHLPAALSKLQEVQQLARSVAFEQREDFVQQQLLDTNYFYSSLDTLGHEVRQFNERARQDSAAFAKQIIDSALLANNLGAQPTLLECDMDILKPQLQQAINDNWVKLDRRSDDDYRVLLAFLSKTILNDFGKNGRLTTQWNPMYWTNTELHLKDINGVVTSLRAIISRFEPATDPVYLQLDIFPPVAVTVVPPPAEFNESTNNEVIPLAQAAYPTVTRL
jgi:hypothetical protein